MSLKNKLFFWSLVFGIWSLVFSSIAFTEETRAKEPIVVDGDKVEYFQDKKQVIGSGNVSITYKDVVLTCDKITVYLDTREGIAEGDVKITQKDAYFTGEKINYNFETRVGRVLKGYVSSKPFYGKADEVDKLSDKEIAIDRGYVTTCDLEQPHYRIQARQIKIYLDDRVVARHILFFIGKTPVLYFPYYVQPLKERSSHITVQVGKDTNWGYYALTSLRYYFSEIAKGRFLVDYRTKKGLASGVDNYYNIEGLGSGSVRFYYANENDSTTFSPSGENESKYRAQVRHKWDMGNDTIVTLEFNKVRDQNFIKDYFYKEYEEGGSVDNYISVITSKENYTATFLLRKRMDKYFTVVERLPEFDLTIPNTRIFKDLPMYYQSDTSGSYLNKTFEATIPTQKDVNTVRFDSYNQLSYAAKLFGFWNITPYAGTRQTYYSRNKWGDTNLVRGIFQAGLDNSTKFYRIYDVETNVLGLDIHRLRHIITPTANFYYTHQPTISPDNLNQFDEIDAIDTANGVLLSLENKLQTKWLQGEDYKSVDLATLIISSDYIYKFKRHSLDLKTSKFKSVDFQLELTPLPSFYSLAKMSVNTKTSQVQNASIDLVASKGDIFSLGLGYRFENVESGESNLATLDSTYKINDKWKVRAYERFNLENGSFEEQEYTLYRDLHCWIMELTYNFKSYTKDQTFWIVMRLKAFPDVPIGLKRTYYRPRFGSAGQD